MVFMFFFDMTHCYCLNRGTLMHWPITKET